MLEAVQPLEKRCVVTIERHGKGSRWPVPRRGAGLVLELRDERGIAARGLEVEREQLLLAKARLAHRRKHAGCRMGRALPGTSCLEHDGAQAVLRSPPSGRKPDHACADDRYVVGVCGFAVLGHGLCLAAVGAGPHVPPFLRRHYPDQVQTVGGDQPPSQPGSPGSRTLILPASD